MPSIADRYFTTLMEQLAKVRDSQGAAFEPLIQRAAARYAAILGSAEPMVIGTRLRFRGVRPFWRVRVGAPTRDAAESLCSRLQKAGGSCLVLSS